MLTKNLFDDGKRHREREGKKRKISFQLNYACNEEKKEKKMWKKERSIEEDGRRKRNKRKKKRNAQVE